MIVMILMIVMLVLILTHVLMPIIQKRLGN